LFGTGEKVEDAPHKEPKEHDVNRPGNSTRPIPPHDYGPAVHSAVSWLGDRYLLAAPVTRRSEERKPYFNQTRHWHPPFRTV
jgi:hypothetical protein